jgi:hypothetical protein
MQAKDLKSSLSRVLDQEDYERLEPYVFKAKWITQGIDHLLFFYTYGNPKQFFHGDFCIRDRQAQEFAISCVRPFMPASFDHVVNNQRHPCFLGYSLGRLASWGIRESLDLNQFNPFKFEEELGRVIRLRLFPVIVSVQNRTTLLDFLLMRSDSLANHGINVGIKISYMAFLRRELGELLPEIIAKLTEEAEEYSILLRGIDIDWRAFATLVAQKLSC